MKIKLEPGVKMPTRAHSTDAGLDIYARETKIVLPRSREDFDTGVHIEIPEGYVGMIKSKSGLMRHHGITTEGTVDCGYTGSICVTLFNHSDEKYTVHKGDKITQLVVMPILNEKLEMVEYLADTDRGDNGFGSSGR
jgi:dUTP pyrophosphatase